MIFDVCHSVCNSGTLTSCIRLGGFLLFYQIEGLPTSTTSLKTFQFSQNTWEPLIFPIGLGHLVQKQVFIKSLPSEGVRRKMKAEVSFLPLGL
jgi:hypothetical protein